MSCIPELLTRSRSPSLQTRDSDNNLSALSVLVTKMSRNIEEGQPLDHGQVFRQLPSQQTGSLVQNIPSSLFQFCLVYSVSGNMSLCLTNLHILTFTGPEMAVRVKFYCVLICRVSRTGQDRLLCKFYFCVKLLCWC